jgi:alanine-synthesizing transaminase
VETSISRTRDANRGKQGGPLDMGGGLYHEFDPDWAESMTTEINTSDNLRGVRYEIRGQLAQRAHEMERQGYEIISMNIGNPGLFGFRTPETMRMAMIENLPSSEAYCHQKGIFPAREAVVMQQQDRGVMNVTAEHVFIGNGVSELIDLTLRALLNAGDEVLIPSP